MKRLISRVLLVSAFVVSCLFLAPCIADRPVSALTGTAGLGQQDCTMYTVGPANQSIPALGGAGICSVDTGSGGGQCVWHASPSDTWIIIDTTDQTGDKTLVFTAVINTGDPRS